MKKENELIEEIKKLTNERNDLRAEAMIMALRLFHEDEKTLSPACESVMMKWRPKVIHFINLHSGE